MSARMVTDDQYSFHAERPRARFTRGGRRFSSGRERSGSIKPETRWTAHPDTPSPGSNSADCRRHVVTYER